MTAKKTKSAPATSGEPTDYREKKQEPAGKKLTFFRQRFFYDWCKGCGICSAFCPKKIILTKKNGKPAVDEPDKCIGCRFCELHCPDFAISISERHPGRRKTDGE